MFLELLLVFALPYPSIGFVDPRCSDYQCSVRTDLRRDCSRKENSRDRCLSRGCCFDNSKFNTTWCFYPLGLPRGRCPHKECQVLPEDRLACTIGGRGVTNARDCSSIGCCLDLDSYGYPYCFRRKVNIIAFTGFHNSLNAVTRRNCERVDPSKRVQCGGYGTVMSQCLRFRCCWVDIDLEGPRCFSPKPPKKRLY